MTTRCEVHRCRELASAEVCRTEYGRYQACPDHAHEAESNGERVLPYEGREEAVALTPARRAALGALWIGPRPSWDFGSSTVSWLRKSGYAEDQVDATGRKALALTPAGVTLAQESRAKGESR